MTFDVIVEEEWRECPIEGYKHYEVSNLGRCRNKKTGRLLKPFAQGVYGYTQLDLYSNLGGERKRILTHRLVWMAFNGEIPLTQEVHHLDDNPANNRLDNLQPLDHRKNVQKRRGGWHWGEGKRRNQPPAKRPMSDEDKEKKRAKSNAFHEARRAALESES